MRIWLRTQPFDADGNRVALGDVLLAAIGSGQYTTLSICAAFVMSSGTSRVYRHLREFRDRGGNTKVYLGIANGLTSRQAVEHLVAAGATVCGFDTGGSVLFHPKVYLLAGAKSAWASIGSSNLTSEGLYRNFEANNIVELDLTDRGDTAYLRTLEAWFDTLIHYRPNCFEIKAEMLDRLVTSGQLVDERVTQQPQRLAPGSGMRRKAAVVGIRVSAAPPPDPTLQGPRTRAPRAPVSATIPQQPPASAAAQFFAMTMSAFDSSHRSGVPGTPEVSLPEDVVGFFPRVSLQGRQYPDAYFDTLLNRADGQGEVVTIRIWQRPPGSATGHADWRLNVSHSIVDLTSPGGGDVLLFEKLPDGSDPPYEVWVVTPQSPDYQSLLARCTKSVQASGRAGTKQYGLF